MNRVLSVILVFVLVFWVFAVPLSQHADALAGVIVAGAVAAVMAMAGISIVTSGMSAYEIQQWVEDKLDQWAADVGSPLETLLNSSGIGVTISGLLVIGTAVANGINSFISWLRNDLALTDNSNVEIISAGVDIDGIEFGYMPEIQFYNGQRTFEQYIVLSHGIAYTLYMDTSTDYYLFYASNEDFTLVRIATRISDGYQQAYTYQATINNNGVYYWSGVGQISIPKSTNNAPNCPYYGEFTTAKNQTLVNLGNNIDVQGNLSLNTGVITLPTVQTDDKIFVDVGALPGSSVTEVTSGVFVDAAADRLSVSGTVAQEQPPFEITGPEPVLGLTEVFPFCIPFDIYNLVSCLAADPVAPSFEWRFYVPGICDETIEIDLAAFNTAAQILRTMELLLFCVGLAFVTRSHIIRS